jgi:hypothetical protein
MKLLGAGAKPYSGLRTGFELTDDGVDPRWGGSQSCRRTCRAACPRTLPSPRPLLCLLSAIDPRNQEITARSVTLPWCMRPAGGPTSVRMDSCPTRSRPPRP